MSKAAPMKRRFTFGALQKSSKKTGWHWAEACPTMRVKLTGLELIQSEHQQRMPRGNHDVLLAFTHVSDRIGVNKASPPVSNRHSRFPLLASSAKKEVRFDPNTKPPPVVIRPACDGRCSLYSQRNWPVATSSARTAP